MAATRQAGPNERDVVSSVLTKTAFPFASHPCLFAVLAADAEVS